MNSAGSTFLSLNITTTEAADCKLILRESGLDSRVFLPAAPH